MNTLTPTPCQRRSRAEAKILALLLVLLGLFGLAVADCFRMDGDGRALRDALKRDSTTSFSRVFQGAVGPVITTLTRCGLRFVDDIPEEALRGAAAVRSARVSVERVKGRLDPRQLPQMTEAADRAMTERDWERLVCVGERSTLVLVYIDSSSQRGSTVQTLVAILESEHLVVVSARLKLRPLLDLGLDAMNLELSATRSRPSAGPGGPALLARILE